MRHPHQLRLRRDLAKLRLPASTRPRAKRPAERLRPVLAERLRLVLLLGLTGCLIAACGSGTKVVSASESPARSSAKPSRTTSSTTGVHASRNTAPTSTTTVTATSTRTSSAPAFAGQESAQHALASAVATVRRQGYTPNDTAQYQPQQTLRVLTATRTGAGAEHEQRAFFFVEERYIGTDASQPSGSLKVLAQGETSVTLGYGMYRPGDSRCCPGGGERSVRFQLDNGRLQALDPIPPARSSSGLARL